MSSIGVSEESLARLQRLQQRIEWYKRDLGDRLHDSKRILATPATTIDIHTHSLYSDGRGTVHQNLEAAINTGLDFLFATDHWSLQQKEIAATDARLLWGQEPPAGPHHIGLLMPRQLFKPDCATFAENMAMARQTAPFVWIPHPCGWYPDTEYTEEAITELQNIGDSFAMEVINGANKAVQAFDRFDAKAVEVWDQLLCTGRRITAIGGSDAHAPEDIGSAWTGIPAALENAEDAIPYLQNGNCFASEGSLLDFHCDGACMGSVLKKAVDSEVQVDFKVADAAGLQMVQIIANGEVVHLEPAQGKTLVTGSFRYKLSGQWQYLRLQAVAFDSRRAFGSPIYLQAK